MRWTGGIWSIGIILLWGISAHAQVADNTWSYKNINNDRYFRLTYDNDFFSATDKYYTQGANIEMASPALKKYWISKLLVAPGYGYARYRIAGVHEGYTPTKIERSDVLYGDRPFAACWYVKTFQISIDTIHAQRFSTTLSTGVIGPAALGGEMQTFLHRALGNVIPHGWDNQIANDVILNYQVNYEKQLVAYRHAFLLDAGGMVRAGTLSDKATLGITLMAGHFESPYSNSRLSARSFRIYAYERPEVNYVAYDATLQGGIFNRHSPYTLSANDINKITFQNRFGFVVTYRKLYLEYFQALLSREFRTGDYHVWGGIQLAVGL